MLSCSHEFACGMSCVVKEAIVSLWPLLVASGSCYSDTLGLHIPALCWVDSMGLINRLISYLFPPRCSTIKGRMWGGELLRKDVHIPENTTAKEVPSLTLTLGKIKWTHLLHITLI